MTADHLANTRRQLAGANRENQRLLKQVRTLSAKVQELQSRPSPESAQAELEAVKAEVSKLTESRAALEAALTAVEEERDEALAKLESASPGEGVDDELAATTRETLAKVMPEIRKRSDRIANSIEEPLEALSSLWLSDDNGDAS